MKANWKNKLNTKTQENVERAVREEFDKIKHDYEKKVCDKFSILFILGVLEYAKEDLGYGEKRQGDMLNGIVARINELSNYLSGNKFYEHSTHTEQYDTEYNIDYLKKLAKRYGLKFDESIFDDDLEAEEPKPKAETKPKMSKDEFVDNLISFANLPGNENIAKALKGENHRDYD